MTIHYVCKLSIGAYPNVLFPPSLPPLQYCSYSWSVPPCSSGDGAQATLPTVYVVFDEADRLFEMGFSEQLLEIIRRLPEMRYSAVCL